MTITVYTGPACPGCAATVRALTNAGIRHTTTPANDDHRERFRASGHRSLPVVVVTNDAGETLDEGSGFLPEDQRPGGARMSPTTHIEHPATGHPVTFRQLSAETGLHENTLRKRYYDGKRGDTLVAQVDQRYSDIRKAASSPANKRQRFLADVNAFLRSPTGRLTTHLFRDFRRGAA